ncbi:hypothetical protein PR202_gb11605 [Eleusine coracana subsp. coracana]|uniref:Peptidase A1 domain-containing protein n=1 Tax=Eleusine coracana subsp. coracana TaxID=191504 RepID=A0AAV5EMC2_ELECO|nr:hypothetical protein QOZ80_3BG0268850 [Eleusine coracana subsp. coracana]GJN23913.1 hypothetical protein PR202_gb11605 [Eleusine coracana subsp. coracana]
MSNKMMHKLLVLLVAVLAIGSTIASSAPVRMQLVHTDAGLGLTPRELLHRMAQRSRARAERLLSEGESVPVTPGKPNDDGVPDTEYLAHFAIGTPAQPVQLTLDSGSDLIWTQCQPCISCFNQSLPVFNASLSSTFADLSCGSAACQDLTLTSCSSAGDHSSSSTNSTPCVYGYLYGDCSVTIGALAADTFVFAGGAAVPAMAFGCGLNNTGIFTSNETGIAGFGRGHLSLPSQLKVHNFSYCFTNITGSTPSHVLLGLPANLHSSSARGVVQTTPFIKNPAKFSTFYYLSLKGITVGSTRLPTPESTFALTNNGTGGTIIDSGTGMTTFPPDVYKLVHDAFIAQTRLPVQNATTTPLCFTLPAAGMKPDVPKLILHFDGATLDLPRDNYMFQLQDSVTCLAVNPGGNLTIIGNYQQQNMHVLYDLANNMLSVAPAQCDQV